MIIHVNTSKEQQKSLTALINSTGTIKNHQTKKTFYHYFSLTLPDRPQPREITLTQNLRGSSKFILSRPILFQFLWLNGILGAHHKWTCFANN